MLGGGGGPPRDASQPPPLVLREQPASLFWKDRGGKKNMLRFVVASPVALQQVRVTARTRPHERAAS